MWIGLAYRAVGVRDGDEIIGGSVPEGLVLKGHVRARPPRATGPVLAKVRRTIPLD
jgi:hypothetical protein